MERAGVEGLLREESSVPTNAVLCFERDEVAPAVSVGGTKTGVSGEGKLSPVFAFFAEVDRVVRAIVITVERGQRLLPDCRMKLNLR
jgi:hypothetical protein